MRSYLQHIFFIIVCLFLSNTGLQAQIMGLDIRFLNQGGSKYQVILTMYRDCRGDSIAVNSDSLSFYAGNNGSLSVLIQKTKLTRISIKDVTPICTYSTPPCK